MVVWAVKQYRHYLYGYYCTVFTNHEALKNLLNTPEPCHRETVQVGNDAAGDGLEAGLSIWEDEGMSRCPLSLPYLTPYIELH